MQSLKPGMYPTWREAGMALAGVIILGGGLFYGAYHLVTWAVPLAYEGLKHAFGLS
jgi:hypothetical protein